MKTIMHIQEYDTIPSPARQTCARIGWQSVNIKASTSAERIKTQSKGLEYITSIRRCKDDDGTQVTRNKYAMYFKAF